MVINFTSLGAEGKAPQEVVSAIPGSSLVLKKNALLDLGKQYLDLQKLISVWVGISLPLGLILILIFPF